jgi:hypothetical protein
MHEMQIDVQHGRIALGLRTDEMIVPDFLEESSGGVWKLGGLRATDQRHR